MRTLVSKNMFTPLHSSQHRRGGRLSTARPSNSDRVLLSLHGCQEHLDRYEYPRRFSQRGLVERLGIAQSHISREVKGLVDDGFIIAERRRVANERRRVTAYILTERGIDAVEALHSTIVHREVLHRSPDGELARTMLGQLMPKLHPLELANVLKQASVHDGLPLIEAATEGDEGELDLSSETIGLLIELAELRISQGHTSEAALHLRRAGTLHRRKGSLYGEVKCLLSAAGLDGRLSEPSKLWMLMKRAGVQRFNGDDLLTMWTHLENEDILSHCQPHLRAYIECLGDGNGFDSIPIAIEGNAYQQAIWRGRLLSLQLSLVDQKKAKMPSQEEVMEILNDLSSGSAARPELVADIALKQGGEGALRHAWNLDLSISSAGHVGFSLYHASGDKEVLRDLMVLFEEEGEQNGVEVCERLLS